MIIPLTGNDLGVEKNDQYRLVEWSDKGRVVFSITRQGDAMKCHFSSDSDALRHIKTAFNEFIGWLFDQYEWCRMIIATIIKDKPSIVRVIEKCGFKHVHTITNGYIYARLRNG